MQHGHAHDTRAGNVALNRVLADKLVACQRERASEQRDAAAAREELLRRYEALEARTERAEREAVEERESAEIAKFALAQLSLQSGASPTKEEPSAEP